MQSGNTKMTHQNPNDLSPSAELDVPSIPALILVLRNVRSQRLQAGMRISMAMFVLGSGAMATAMVASVVAVLVFTYIIDHE